MISDCLTRLILQASPLAFLAQLLNKRTQAACILRLVTVLHTKIPIIPEPFKIMRLGASAHFQSGQLSPKA